MSFYIYTSTPATVSDFSLFTVPIYYDRISLRSQSAYVMELQSPVETSLLASQSGAVSGGEHSKDGDDKDCGVGASKEAWVMEV